MPDFLKRKIVLVILIVLTTLILLLTFYYAINGVRKSCEEQKSDTIINTSINLEQQITPWNIEVLGIDIKKVTNSNNRKVKIAVIDSGIYKEHEDLYGIIVKEFNAINQDEQIIDEFGHGTAIAGIIGGLNNGIGVVGIAADIEIYDVKVLDKHGKGEVRNLITALDWCIEQNVDIINISFGYQTESVELKSAIDRAVDEGIIIVAAAGNTYGFGVDYPARYESVISISAVNKDLKRPSSAARGKIEFVAPGTDILTTNNNGNYSYFNGTSFATAHATGIIALILQDRDLSNTEIISTLIENVLDLGEEGYDREYGHGLLQAN